MTRIVRIPNANEESVDYGMYVAMPVTTSASGWPDGIVITPSILVEPAKLRDAADDEFRRRLRAGRI